MKTQAESTLLELVRYNQWMNQRLLAICSGLDEEVVSTDIPGTFGSIRATFGHLLRAEASFLQRIHGTSPQPNFDWESAPTLAQLATYAQELSEAFLETIQTISPTQNVHEENETWSFDYQARLIFMSLIYHGIAHRTDITTFLHRQEIALPELDIWGYQEVYPERFQAKLIKNDDA